MSIKTSYANENPKDFQSIFEQYKNLVFKTAFLMTGNTTEAEDILQEVFLSVYKYLSTYNAQKGAFSTWLHRITINQCSANRRKERFHYEYVEDSDEINNILSPTPGNDNTGQTERIQQAVAGLSEKLRAVIILRYYWELPYGDISQILDIPLGTVKSRLDMAFRIIRSEITTTTPEQAESQKLEKKTP